MKYTVNFYLRDGTEHHLEVDLFRHEYLYLQKCNCEAFNDYKNPKYYGPPISYYSIQLQKCHFEIEKELLYGMCFSLNEEE